MSDTAQRRLAFGIESVQLSLLFHDGMWVLHAQHRRLGETWEDVKGRAYVARTPYVHDLLSVLVEHVYDVFGDEPDPPSRHTLVLDGQEAFDGF